MRMCGLIRVKDGRSGSALLLALWTVVLLTLMVSSFAFDMHLEAKITSYYRKRLRAGCLAQAGVERAKMLLVQSGDPEIGEETFKKKDAEWYLSAKNLAHGAAVNYIDKLETGTATVDIVPVIAMRNVNLLGSEEWQWILKVGNVPQDMWDELIDSFLDWTDPDAIPRRYGAELDYYTSLPEPYKPRNGPIDSIDELLLVRGFTPEVLDGGPGAGEDEPGMAGIRDLMTTYGDGTVNVNAASQRVLMTLPGIDDVIAEDIIQERETPLESAGSSGNTATKNETRLFKDANDFFGRFPTLNSSARKYITTAPGTYRITSTGSSQGVTRVISCVANVDRRTGELAILQWQEGDGR